SLWVDSERLTLNDHLFSQHRIRERAIRLALLPLENISFELFSLAIEVFNQNQRTTHINGLSVETGDKILIHGVHDFAWCEQHNVMFAEGSLFGLLNDRFEHLDMQQLADPQRRCGEGRAMRGIPRKRREYYADNYMKLMKTEWSHARVH